MLDTGCSILDSRRLCLDAGYLIWDGEDLFPLRKEPVLSETEGGLRGCRDGPVGRLNIKKNRAGLQT